jgi:hypothetical protein
VEASQTTFGDEFQAGVQAGVARAFRGHLFSFEEAVTASEVFIWPETPPWSAEGTRNSLRSTVELLANREVNGRFVQLFTELVTVATLSRDAFNESPLEPWEIEQFLEHAEGFFNSFRHA